MIPRHAHLLPRVYHIGPVIYGQADTGHHIIQRTLNSDLLSAAAPYEVAGNIRQAHCSPHHSTHFEPSSFELRGTI